MNDAYGKPIQINILEKFDEPSLDYMQDKILNKSTMFDGAMVPWCAISMSTKFPLFLERKNDEIGAHGHSVYILN